MINPAFLFDIDGCLTLPDYDYSILDWDLIDKILDISKNHPVALVTGRSNGWLESQLEDAKPNILDLTIYFEFGMVVWKNNDLNIIRSAQDFVNVRDHYISAFAEICNTKDVYFEPDTMYDDFPNHGSLWVENKHVQLSIASNTSVSTQQVHDIANLAWTELNDARVLHHHLGVDVIPTGWSKSKATEHFLQANQLDETEYQWYVFGDNHSDKEMSRKLSRSEFIHTKVHASNTVRQELHNILN